MVTVCETIAVLRFRALSIALQERLPNEVASMSVLPTTAPLPVPNVSAIVKLQLFSSLLFGHLSFKILADTLYSTGMFFVRYSVFRIIREGRHILFYTLIQNTRSHLHTSQRAMTVFIAQGSHLWGFNFRCDGEEYFRHLLNPPYRVCAQPSHLINYLGCRRHTVTYTWHLLFPVFYHMYSAASSWHHYTPF